MALNRISFVGGERCWSSLKVCSSYGGNQTQENERPKESAYVLRRIAFGVCKILQEIVVIQGREFSYLTRTYEKGGGEQAIKRGDGEETGRARQSVRLIPGQD